MFPDTLLSAISRLKALGLLQDEKDLALIMGRGATWISNLRRPDYRPLRVPDRAVIRLYRHLCNIRDQAAPRIRPEVEALIDTIDRDRRVIEFLR